MAGFRLALCAHALNPRKIDLEADVQALTFTTMVSGYRETRIVSSAALDRREAADRQASRIAEATEYGSGAALNHSAKGRDKGAA